MCIRNYSEHTIRNYIGAIEKLCKYFNLPPDKITTSQVKKYIYHRIKDEGIAPSTVNQIISIWKIMQLDILKRDYKTIEIKRAKRVSKIPDILTREQVLKLISSPKNLKHKTILTLLYSTGIRLSELLTLKPIDIDSGRMVINIRSGKGNKDRQVVLNEELLLLLREYYKKFTPKNYLFEGHKVAEKYSTTSVRNIIKKAAEAIGIKKRVYPHLLRHCFATHLIEAGTNIKVVQNLLGHGSIKSTLAYMRLIKLDNVFIPNLLSDGTQ